MATITRRLSRLLRFRVTSSRLSIRSRICDRSLAQADVCCHLAHGGFFDRLNKMQENQLRAGQPYPLDQLFGIQVNGLNYLS
ncbi:MAG: hypothetical protein R2860_10740 [Desulfobacterales bacterium]